MNALLLPLLIIVSINSYSQEKPDSALMNKLKEMYHEDQKWRKEYIKLSNGKSIYTIDAINKNEANADSLNYLEAKKIVNKYGFPGYDLLGNAGSSRFWAIVQHCDNDVAFQKKVLKLMYSQVKRKNASGEDYAYLKDRVLSNSGKKQLYGTQLKFNPKTKHSTPFPIQDSVNVDKRRAEMGMSSLADYIKDSDSYYN